MTQKYSAKGEYTINGEIHPFEGVFETDELKRNLEVDHKIYDSSFIVDQIFPDINFPVSGTVFLYTNLTKLLFTRLKPQEAPMPEITGALLKINLEKHISQIEGQYEGYWDLGVRTEDFVVWPEKKSGQLVFPEGKKDSKVTLTLTKLQ